MPDKEKQYLSDRNKNRESSKNVSIIAISLYIIGVLCIIGGIFQGLRLLNEAHVITNNSHYIRYIAMAYLGGGIICGVLFIGFGRNISLLKNINDKLENM